MTRYDSFVPAKRGAGAARFENNMRFSEPKLDQLEMFCRWPSISYLTEKMR